MRKSKRFGVARAGMVLSRALLVLAVAWLAGCQSTGYVKSDAAAYQLQTTAGQVRAESKALDSTTTALNDLVNSTSGDLRIQYQHFSRCLDQLAADSRRLSTGPGRLQRKQTSYFEAWDQQLLAMNDDEIRKRSEARKAEVSSQYDATVSRHQEAQDALSDLVVYLADIRKALSADLTTDGLVSNRPAVTTANERATRVQSQLTQSAADLDALGARMSTFVASGSK